MTRPTKAITAWREASEPGRLWICGCYFHFSRGLASGGAAVAVAAYAALGSALYLKAVPDVTLPAALVESLGLRSATLTSEALAGGLPIVLMLFSRLPQIVQNARQGHAGQLALATYLLNTLGGAARVFTTLQELDDRIAALQLDALAVRIDTPTR